MPRNLEVKAKIDSAARIREAALRCGASPRGAFVQVDTYFCVPGGRLKLRVIDGSDAELISYLRQEDAAERWSDYQKVPVSDGERMRAILAHALGIRAVVRKRRELFMYGNCRIHLDDVEGLGTFLEFEVPAAGEPDPQILLEELKGLFNVTGRDEIRGSYVDMIRPDQG